MGKYPEIRWLGQMGFLLKTEKTTVCIDYFASPHKDRQVQPPIPAAELRGIDAFLGTTITLIISIMKHGRSGR